MDVETFTISEIFQENKNILESFGLYELFIDHKQVISSQTMRKEGIEEKIAGFKRQLVNAAFQRRNGRNVEDCEVGLEMEKFILGRIDELKKELPSQTQAVENQEKAEKQV